jgi:putative NADH-flavin reductase
MAEPSSTAGKRVLVIFGATGATGKHVLTKALAQGTLKVRVFVRTPSKLPTGATSDANLEVVQGSFEDLPAVDKALEGADFVISCAGDAAGSKNHIMEKFMKQVIESARKYSVKRILYQAGAFSNVPGLKMPIKGKILGATLAPMMGISAMIKDNTAVIAALSEVKDIEWIVTRPGMLKEAPSAGKVKITPKLSTTLTFVDVAEFELMAVQTNQYNHTAPFLTV